MLLQCRPGSNRRDYTNHAVPEVYNYSNYSTPDDKITAIDLKDFDVFHLWLFAQAFLRTVQIIFW